MKFSVAIDGPSGAGKSSIAKIVAQKLDIIYLDTGALYRAIALYMLENNINVDNMQNISDNLSNIDIKIKYENSEQKVILNNEDVSEKIRENKVSLLTSVVSSYKCVREFLLGIQRDIAKQTSVIMDGRDIATVVLPDATVKIFLSASAKERANRRYKQLLQKGEKVNFDDILSEINKRDYNDINRKESPLIQAEDAILLNTDDLDLNQAVEKILEIIKERVNNL